MPIFRLPREVVFPDPSLAEPDGLLAVGGDLSPERLLRAYAEGIFPWFNEGSPILWWSPDPRLVLFPDELHVSSSLARTLRRGRYRVTADQAFGRVIRACSWTERPGQDGTWITDEMIAAYEELHRLGFAHSFEAWSGETLAGGLYGVSLGGAFFGESMFSERADASKAAFVGARPPRRSISSFVSPGPRPPIPPASRDSESSRPTRRGYRYLSWASSTCSLPSALWARWAKMSRMSWVRSSTFMLVASATPRACEGLSS